MAATGAPAAGSGFGSTLRRDAWWVEVLPVIVLLGGFGLYATLRAFEGKFYEWGPYLSPFYSPLIDANHRWWKWSPAILILGGPLSFRATCYYYRKAYYRAFAGSPPGCAVGPLAGGRTYRGETALLVFQNLHRYALDFALAFIVILGKDAVEGFFKDGKPGIGVGSVILTINVVLIASYTFGCHSFRHLIGGRSDCMSCGKNTIQLGAWKRATWFNIRHMQFAWASLIWVMVTDLYIRLYAMGVIKDLHTW